MGFFAQPWVQGPVQGLGRVLGARVPPILCTALLPKPTVVLSCLLPTPHQTPFHHATARSTQSRQRRRTLLNTMCRQVQCSSCKKPSWAGCGMHVDSVSRAAGVHASRGAAGQHPDNSAVAMTPHRHSLLCLSTTDASASPTHRRCRTRRQVASKLQSWVRHTHWGAVDPVLHMHHQHAALNRHCVCTICLAGLAAACHELSSTKPRTGQQQQMLRSPPFFLTKLTAMVCKIVSRMHELN